MKIRIDKKGRYVIAKKYTKIKVEDLKAGDSLVIYNMKKLKPFKDSAWWAMYHGRNCKKKYGRVTLPPYHAVKVYGRDEYANTLILDTEIRTTLSFLDEYMDKPWVRIDAIRSDARDDQRAIMIEEIYKSGKSEKAYDWKGYLGHAKEMPYYGWILSPFKGNTDRPYCSDEVARISLKAGERVSYAVPNRTAPKDLLIYGLVNFQMYTLKEAKV